jgi:hypothetical protein
MTRSRTWLVVALVISTVGVAAWLVFRPDRPGAASPPQTRVKLQVKQRPELVREQLFAELQPVKLTNCDLRRFGEPHDGGYLMCGNLLEAVQSGYSYGISGYDQWGCDISHRLEVRVHQYDCFDVRRPVCGNGTTVFHAECVGPKAATIEGRRFDTVENQFISNGDGAARVVVKMDVEGAEWETFLQTPDAVLERIDQLSVELHGAGEERYLAAVLKLKRFFYVANLHFNNYSCQPDIPPFPSWAYEVLFVNKRLGVPDPSGSVRGPHPLDAPNKPEVKDCQVPSG